PDHRGNGGPGQSGGDPRESTGDARGCTGAADRGCGDAAGIDLADHGGGPCPDGRVRTGLVDRCRPSCGAVTGLGGVLARWMVSAVVGIVVVLIPGCVSVSPWAPTDWSFGSCDVGQGDASVLRTGVEYSAVLVDSGPGPGRITKCLERLGITRIPLLILTHLHADHIGGLAGVLREFPVGAVAVGTGRTPEWARQQVAERAAAADVPVRALQQGQRLRWPELRLTVLAPDEESSAAVVAGDSGTAVNNTSVVLRATTTAGRILLTGDVELAAQAALLAGEWDLTA